MLISICVLTSPAHTGFYEEGTVNIPSLHFVGDEDTRDIKHMAGRTAGSFGPGSGICLFRGGHKLPSLTPLLALARNDLDLASRGYLHPLPVAIQSAKEGVTKVPRLAFV